MNSRLLEAVFASVPLPMILINGEERVELMNDRATEMFGAMARGHHYITALRNPALLDCVEVAFRLRQPRRIRYLTTEGPREAAYEATATPLGESAGGGVLLCFEDVTERERAGDMRRDFVANVSHELKTPLTALLGFIETLRGPARNDAAARERFLGIMEREAERMNRLVSDLLSLNRVESEERVRPTNRVDVIALVKSTVQTLRPMAEEAGVTLEFTGREEPVLVQGDADQLVQVFTNLIENAIKYGAGGGLVTVAANLSERELAFRGPGVTISVTDKGEGFDPVHIPRLTERFYRIDNHRSREMGGTGLGLAIVKHIVNRHRGRFRIESKPGEGSRFSVILPVD